MTKDASFEKVVRRHAEETGQRPSFDIRRRSFCLLVADDSLRPRN
jgi:hypothetical protein